MDFQQIFIAFLTLISGAGGTFLAVELVKWLPKVNINDGDKVKLRTTAAACAAIITAVVGLLSGNLDPAQIQSVLVAVVVAVGAWGGAHGIHKLDT